MKNLRFYVIMPVLICALDVAMAVIPDERRYKMTFSYNNLWKILIDRKMKKKDLMSKTGITGTTIAKMGRGEPVSLEVIGRICKALNLNVGDIVDFVE